MVDLLETGVWEHWLVELQELPDDADADEWLDERLEALESMRTVSGAAPGVGVATARGMPTGDPTAFWLAALARACSELTRRDVAMQLALGGRIGDIAVNDALVAAYQGAQADASLGPALLGALALRAEQDPTARPNALGALLRVSDGAPRFLIIRAAKIIGRFEGLGIETHMRAKLDAWANADDLAVQGEARQQLAALALFDALAQPKTPQLLGALKDCRVAFARAEACEEQRQDARLLGALLDLFIVHLEAPTGDSTYAESVGAQALVLQSLLDNPFIRPWAGYASSIERMIEHRVYRVAVGFAQLAADVHAMPDWTNFDAELVELAATWQLMWERAGGLNEREFIGRCAIDVGGTTRAIEAGAAVVLPRIGSFLERAINRQRLLRVTEREEAMRGSDDGVSRTLRAFYEAACRIEHNSTDLAALSVNDEALVSLATTSPATVASVLSFIPGVEAILRKAGLELAADQGGLRAYCVPTDHPACYGDDPGVDDTVRPLFLEVWRRLAPRYPKSLWDRFVSLTVRIVQIARDLRSDLPDFVLSDKETGGKGQTASEDDLQTYVFRELRRCYGRYVHWEPMRIAGGRADVGVFFPEGGFPIEAKAEYRDIQREHVRVAYLPQADRYATDRDRVSFLLILDLRAENAGAETALYSLRDSFRVDCLPPDPQIVGAQTNAIIVGLFPGNQLKPSSMTVYSRRPRAPSGGRGRGGEPPVIPSDSGGRPRRR